MLLRVGTAEALPIDVLFVEAAVIVGVVVVVGAAVDVRAAVSDGRMVRDAGGVGCATSIPLARTSAKVARRLPFYTR